MTSQQAVLNNDAIRAAIEACLPADPSASLPAQQLFLPWPHRKALQLDCSLVIGARGVGKTAWARALLANQDNQPSEALPIQFFPYPLTVVAGFSDQAQASHPSPGTFAQLMRDQDDPYSLWLAVLLRSLDSSNTSTLPTESWAATLTWVRGHQEEGWAMLCQADHALLQENRGILFVFDALDRVSPNGDWLQVSDAIRALLRLILELKGFKRLHAKSFCEPINTPVAALSTFPISPKSVPPALSCFGLLLICMAFSGNASAMAHRAKRTNTLGPGAVKNWPYTHAA